MYERLSRYERLSEYEMSVGYERLFGYERILAPWSKDGCLIRRCIEEGVFR